MSGTGRRVWPWQQAATGAWQGRACRAGRPYEGVTRQAAHPPALHEPGAQTLVEPEGGLVPVEHRPFHAAAAALDRDRGHTGEQLPADTAPAPFRDDQNG